MSETWRPIPGYEGRYEVSDHGRVLSTKGRKPRLLSIFLTNGYPQVKMDRRKMSVHILVAAAWHGSRPDGLDVCHNNGVKTDCRPGNLRYDTRQANIQDSIRHGTFAIGERSPHHKLTEADVREIRSSVGVSPYALAERFGVSRILIRRVLDRMAWPHAV